jgi:hypothetical protein
MGQQDGTNTASNAQSVGFPGRVNLWCDLEGVNEETTAQDVIDYCNAWYTAISTAGYVPGLYVGSDAILTGQQLYDDLLFEPSALIELKGRHTHLDRCRIHRSASRLSRSLFHCGDGA